MAETGIITLDSAGEISYQFEEEYAPVEIIDSTDETRTPLSVLISEVNRLQQQVAALTQMAKKLDSVCSVLSFVFGSSGIGDFSMHVYNNGIKQRVLFTPTEILFQYFEDNRWITYWQK